MGLQMSRRRNGVAYKFDYITEKTEIFFNNFEQLYKYGYFPGKKDGKHSKSLVSKSLTSEHCQVQTIKIDQTRMPEIQHDTVCNLNENKMSNCSSNSINNEYIDHLADDILSGIINMNGYKSNTGQMGKEMIEPIRKETNLFDLT